VLKFNPTTVKTASSLGSGIGSDLYSGVSFPLVNSFRKASTDSLVISPLNEYFLTSFTFTS